MRRELREIAKHDYLILAFTHFRSNEFQGVLDKLARHYQPYLSLMNRGRGVIVWKVTGVADRQPRSGSDTTKASASACRPGSWRRATIAR